MTRSLLPLALTILTLCATACDGGRRELARQPIGKADLTGSCSGFCDGPSAGNCWCDDLCSTIGDCCEDKAALCDDPGDGACCDSADVPQCFEGASCCADGTWQCNDGQGGSTCEQNGGDGELCTASACCDVGTAPQCFEGASCCADGTWACNDGQGQPTCESLGQVCT